MNFALKASNLFVPQLQQLQVKQIHHHFGRCHAFPFSGAFSEFTNSPGINASFWWFITSLSLHNAWSQTKNIQKYENSLPEVPQTFDGFCHISHFCTWYFSQISIPQVTWTHRFLGTYLPGHGTQIGKVGRTAPTFLWRHLWRGGRCWGFPKIVASQNDGL